MFTRHHGVWPKNLPKGLDYPRVPLFEFLEVSARRYGHKDAVIYYGSRIGYPELLRQVEAVAGGLASMGIRKGDRVGLYALNSPQFIIAFFGIVRAGAVAVPVNPMLREEEISVILADSGARLLFAGQELYPRVSAVRGRLPELEQVILLTYSEYIQSDPGFAVPEFALAPRVPIPDVIPWSEFLRLHPSSPAVEVGPDDLAVLPYTSGSTGVPKGCMHTHASVVSNVVGGVVWSNGTARSTSLSVLPLFHVTGMVHSMIGPIYSGGTIVLLSRWDREVAARFIQEYRVTTWVNISTMVVDFLHNPNLMNYDISSLQVISGGGAAMPAAVAERLFELTGVKYREGYGLSETIAQVTMNPSDRPKLQCLGIPAPDVDCKVLDLVTGQELGPGQEGELVVTGPMVMKGYWNKPQDTAEAFITMEGVTYFRTGDIVKYDEEGYFFIVDRVKRMINASGFKVWPTEVETFLYRHPAVAEACVVGAPDPRKGEEVKAYIVVRAEFQGKVTPEEIMAWCQGKMAAYKYPRQVEFVGSLPKGGTGKIQWRELQEQERQKAAARAAEDTVRR